MKVCKQKDDLLFSVSHWEQSEELLAEFSGWKRFHKEMVCFPLLEAFNDQLKAPVWRIPFFDLEQGNGWQLF